MATTFQGLQAYQQAMLQTLERQQADIDLTIYPWGSLAVSRDYATYAAEFDRRREQEQAARDRARQLLLGYLNDEQRREFEKTVQFVVYGSMTGTHYRLTTSRSFGIDVLILDKQVGKLCATPRDMVPAYDHMLAQKLMIETDEPRFLKLANGY